MTGCNYCKNRKLVKNEDGSVQKIDKYKIGQYTLYGKNKNIKSSIMFISDKA